MDWILVLIIFVGGLIIFMAMGLPVAFAFLLMNLLTSYFLMGEVGLSQMILSIFNSLTKFTFAPVPLFVLMGAAIFYSGQAARIIDVLDMWLGRMPGRLSLLAVGSGTVFGAMSGSTMATAATLGTVLMPEMERRGYQKPMTIGPILASGSLAMIIPPSIIAVILGSVALISVGHLLIGGIVPGLIMAGLYAMYIIGRCLLQPAVAPVYKSRSIPFFEKTFALVRYVLPLFAIIFLVLGTIFVGVSTPTEAAALGAVGAIVIVAAYGKMNLQVMAKSLRSSVEITVMSFMIIAGSISFSQILAYSGASHSLIRLAANLAIDPTLVVIVMLAVVVILGTFMEQISMIMLTIPIFMPVVHTLGINPLWFGIVLLITLEVGLKTPPFGLLLFIIKGVSPPSVTMLDIYRATIPFILCDFIAITLLVLLPSIALWLPGMLT